MKCSCKFILLSLTISLLVYINATKITSQSKTETEFESGRYKYRHQLHRFRQDDADCGCKIVYAYFEGPKKPKKKKYKRRWPAPKDIPVTPKPKKPPTVCDPTDGQNFLAEIRKFFPKSISKRKPKHIVNKKSDGTVVTTVSTTTTSSGGGPPTGPFTKLLFDRCKTFKDRVTKDQKLKIGMVTGGKKSAAGKAKQKKLTAQEQKRLQTERMKKKYMKAARIDCYSKIRRYLEVQYRIPYKGTKCHIIGRLLWTCMKLV